jgi:NitT/TauT family transport system substrate-binding protein
MVGLVTAAVTAMAAAGCTSSSANAAPEKPKITVGVLGGSIGCAPALLAQQQGFYSSQGLSVSTRVEVSDAAGVADLASGAVDVVCGGYPTYLAGQAGGQVQLHIAAEGYVSGADSVELVTPPSMQAHYADPVNLNGARVAIDANDATGELTLGARLSEVNIKLTDVTLVTMPEAQMAQAVKSGSVAAAVMAQPYAAAALQAGLASAENLASGLNQSMPLDGYFTKQSFQLSDPHTVAAFTRALDTAQLLSSSSFAVRNAVAAEKVGFDASVTAVMAVGTFPTTVDPARLQLLANEMLNDNLLPVRLTISDLTAGSVNLVS